MCLCLLAHRAATGLAFTEKVFTRLHIGETPHGPRCPRGRSKRNIQLQFIAQKGLASIKLTVDHPQASAGSKPGGHSKSRR